MGGNDRRKLILWLGCALSSAFLARAAFPTADWTIVAWFALVPLLSAVHRATNPAQAWRVGFVFGGAFYALLIPWMLRISVPGYVATTVVCGLFWGTFSGLVRFIDATPIVTGFLWLITEHLRSACGFDWGTLGYSQAKNLTAIQVADLTGVYGVSFLVVTVNAVLARGVVLLWARSPGKLSIVVRHVFVTATFLGAALLYGRHQLGREWTGPMLHVGVVQPNVPEAAKTASYNDRSVRRAVLEKLQGLSAPLAADGVDLILWPETSLPGLYEFDPSLRFALQAAVDSAEYALLAGAVTGGLQIDEPKFNSALLLSPHSLTVERYDKRYLVPVVERRTFFATLLMPHGANFRGYTPGRDHGPILCCGIPLGVSICYEDTFAEALRQSTRRGAQVLVNLSNDGWAGRTPEPYQHWSMAVLRAVENRRFLVRCANTGLSGVVDPTGRVVATAARDSKQVLVDGTLSLQVPALSELTPYTRWGEWPVLVGAVLGFMVVVRRLTTHFK